MKLWAYSTHLTQSLLKFTSMCRVKYVFLFLIPLLFTANFTACSGGDSVISRSHADAEGISGRHIANFENSSFECSSNFDNGVQRLECRIVVLEDGKQYVATGIAPNVKFHWQDVAPTCSVENNSLEFNCDLTANTEVIVKLTITNTDTQEEKVEEKVVAANNEEQEGEIESNNQPTESWTATNTSSAPSIRESHTAVWTGAKMIVFGGVGVGGSLYVNTGGQYDPVSDSWTTTDVTTAPSIRASHTAVWTGSKMLIFGGTIGGGVGFNTGALYDPAANSWSAMDSTTAPSNRFNHTAIWTGQKMIVFGGFNFNITSIYLNTGGQYDPSNNTWTAIETSGAPSVRERHTTVWTGSKMIVYGGWEGFSVNTGGLYDPNANTWRATETTGAPSIRHWHSAVWTGSKMIVFGGSGYGGGAGSVNTGGMYDSNANTWSPTNITGAPSARPNHTAVWTGSKMVIFGGSNGDSTGGLFDPSNNSWVATTITGAPQARTKHTAVWTDSKMIIFGGAPYMNTGGVYTPQ